MHFTDLFIRRPVLAMVVSALILLVGARSYDALALRQFPQMYNTTVSVVTSYPGASAAVMQGFITQPLEQSIASAEGIDYMTSSSSQGQSTITVYVKLNFDPDKALTEVIAKADQVKYVLPQGAVDPIITKSTGSDTALVYLRFASPTLGAAAMSDFIVRVVEPMIDTVPGISSITLAGGQPFAMRVWLDPTSMAAHNVTADDVANAIKNNNFQSAPGQVKGYFTATNISADTDLSTVDDFKNLVVSAKNDALVRMRDIAEVELGPQSYDSTAIANLRTSIAVPISGTPDSNPLDTARAIRQLMPAIERTLPPGLEVNIAYDATAVISASINEVIRTLGLAVAIVILVIFLFLGSLRSVIIPVLTIPLSMIGALAVMLALGFSLNLLTLLAMVLAIGLVVDDAIVVVENVYRGIEAGRTPVQAALIGAREIVGPVVSMTITLAAVYTPVGFLGGVTGALFREFAFTLAASVLLSGIIALTLSPMMCSVLLKEKGKAGWFERHVEDFLHALTERYAKLLHRSMNFRPVTLVFAGGIVAILVLEYIAASKELAPPEDNGFVIGVIKAPQSVNLDFMDKYVLQFQETAMKTAPEIATSFAIAGVGGFNHAFSGNVLKPWSERHRTSADVQAAIQDQVTATIAGATSFLVLPPALPGNTGGLPVQMVVSTTNSYTELFKYMDQIKQRAKASKLFIVTDSDLDYNQPEVHLHVNRAKASDLGLTMETIGNTITLLVGENYINRFNLDGRSYEVIAQVPRSERLTPEKLMQYYVKTASGDLVPLSTVVSIATETGPNALTQYNQLNSATFGAVMYPGRTMGEGVAFLQKAAAEILPHDYQHDFLSEARQYAQEGNSLTVTFVFALIVIYLVLAAQFESLRDPLVILVSVPMALCGAMLPIFFHATTLNIYTEVGLVTLVGLIAKHGILMVEFANKAQVEHDIDRRTAIEMSAKVRLRPILMTTAAMVAGLFPLLVASGAGAASRHAIGIVIVMGMSIGTVFTLFVLPTVYSFLAENHRKRATSGRSAEIASVTNS